MRVHLALVLLALSGCLPIHPPGPEASPTTPAGAQARALIADGARLLDVRMAFEFEGGHVQGAMNIPVGDLYERVAELEPKDKPIVVYCRSGHRSARAVSILQEAGYSQVFDLGSIRNW